MFAYSSARATETRRPTSVSTALQLHLRASEAHTHASRRQLCEMPEALLVAEATDYVHALAALPVSEDDERLIDAFLESHLGARETEPL